jgi:arylsulfatase A-like enzyme
MPFSLPASLSRFHTGLLFFALVMVLFSVARGLLYLRYPAEFATLGGGAVLQAFANGLRFDASIIGRLFAIPLLLLWLPHRLFDRPWWRTLWGWLLYLITVVLLLLLAGDLIYYGHVQRHLSYELVLLANDLQFLLAFGLQSQLGTVLLFLLCAVLLGWVWRRILAIPLRASRHAAPKFLGLALLLLLVGRGGPTGKIIEIIDAYEGGDATYGNLTLNGAFTTAAFALNLDPVNHHFMPQPEAVALVRNGEPVLDADYPMLRRISAEPNGRNVVFVLLESWNFDYVDSFAGSSHGVTPHFDALAREGLRFTRFFAAGQRSIDGIQATLTGIPTLKGMPRIDTGIGVSNFSRLGGLVRERGYSTLFVQSSDRDSFKIQGIATAAGFDAFYGREDIPLLLDYPQPDGAIFGWDHETLQFMKQRIDEMPQPFLAYAFTGTTHEPYADLPARFMQRENEPNGVNGYLNTLGYADWSVGQFMAAARQMPWFDNTLFIFTADHANHYQTGALHQRFHTPLLLYAPKWIAAGESRVVGSQLDVMPTILDLLGIDSEYAALGESLLRKGGEGEAFVSYGGQNIGLITDEGFVRHDLQQLLEHQGVEASRLEPLTRRLLAKDQLVYELLQTNRWAR